MITRARAIRIAVAALRHELQLIAFDANAYDHLGARYPQACAAAKRSRELRAAIEIIETEPGVKVNDKRKRTSLPAAVAARPAAHQEPHG